MYSLSFIIGLILVGIFAGFVSGLLGVGGGFLFVPFQYFLMVSEGIDASLAMIVSIATSLAIIIPTALSGAYNHQKVNKSIIKPGITLGVFGIIGSFLGGKIALYIPISTLQLIFAILLIFVASDMIYKALKDNSSIEDNEKPLLNFNIVYALIVGLIIGLLSGLLGVGGGIFITPILVVIFGFSMKKAIGTSSVFIALTAIGGMFSYMISGIGVSTLSYSIGYVSLVNWGLIVLFSVPMAYIGSKFAYKIPERSLKIVFAILIFFVAFKILGFDPISWILSIN